MGAQNHFILPAFGVDSGERIGYESGLTRHRRGRS